MYRTCLSTQGLSYQASETTVKDSFPSVWHKSFLRFTSCYRIYLRLNVRANKCSFFHETTERHFGKIKVSPSSLLMLLALWKVLSGSFSLYFCSSQIASALFPQRRVSGLARGRVLSIFHSLFWRGKEGERPFLARAFRRGSFFLSPCCISTPLPPPKDRRKEKSFLPERRRWNWQLFAKVLSMHAS